MLSVLCLALCLSAPGQMTTVHLQVQGRDRTFLVYVPAGAATAPGATPDAKTPAQALLIALHGRFGTGSGMVRLADFRPLADREGIILVYPDGIDRSWNDGRLKTPAHEKGIDDVAFIGHLMDYMITHYPVDSTRMYVTGMSNGGFMTSRLGCTLSQRIAAIAVVAASVDRDPPCTPALPLPVMYIHGTDDPIVPYEGGEIKRGSGAYIDSQQQALDRWSAVDGCDKNPRTTTLRDSVGDGTTIKTSVYTNPSTGIEVVGITVVHGGHTWPGGWPYLPKGLIGITSRNLDANEAIWAFFRKYQRVASPGSAGTPSATR